MKGPFKLKYKNSSFPFKSNGDTDIQNVGVSNMVMNKIAMNRIKKVEEEIGNPSKWTKGDKNKLQKSLNTLKTVRKNYPISDSSHEEDEYKVTEREDL